MSREITARVTQISASASQAEARQHVTLIDRPLTSGGSDRGPMGGELLLMGVGGCLMSNLLALAAKQSLALADTRIEIAATLDGEPPRFTAVHLRVHAGGADRTTLLPLVAAAEQACISVNTLRAQVALTVDLA